MYDIMYTIYELEEPIFVWNAEKELINIKKHKVSFTEAAYAYLDPNSIDIIDYSHSEYEERHRLLGYYNTLLIVTYTLRNEKIRIISARKANRKEENEYYARY